MCYCQKNRREQNNTTKNFKTVMLRCDTLLIENQRRKRYKTLFVFHLSVSLILSCDALELVFIYGDYLRQKWAFLVLILLPSLKHTNHLKLEVLYFESKIYSRRE